MERRKVSDKNGGLIRRFKFGSMSLYEAYRFFISFVYPNICPCCEEVIEYDEDFCQECKDKIVLYDGNYNIEYADEFVAYCLYTGKIRRVIRRFKYDSCGNSYYAFAFNIVQVLHTKQLASEINAVVYIPMTKEDERKRGFNQTKLIANEIHHLLDIPCLNILSKIKTTRSQKSLNQKERLSNIDGAFSIKDCKFDIKGKCILLIDDLCTTGSTLSEAAKVLKNAGAEKVIAASFAKTKGDNIK